MEQAIIEFIAGMAAKQPILLSVLAGIGIARLIFKPLFTFLQSVVDATPTMKDNEFLAKVMESKVYKGLAFVLDYVGSIKIPK